MYAVDSILPLETVPAGTTIVVTGTDAAACTAVSDRLQAAGLSRGEPAILISTRETPTDVRTRLQEGVEDADAPIAVVSSAPDCERAVDDLTRCVDSPSDFSSVGMACSELLDRIDCENGVRVSIDGVSDMLDVADVNTVFRFLHVLTGRIRSADGLGVATLQTDRHDEQTCNTIGQLFDERVEVRRRSDARELRMRGTDRAKEEWSTF